MTTACRTVKNGSVFRSLTNVQVGGTGGVARGHKIVGYWLMGCVVEWWWVWLDILWSSSFEYALCLKL